MLNAMANINEEKRYGLIPAKKAQLSAPKPMNVFGDDSDSDSDAGTDWVKKSLKSSAQKGTKKQTQLDMQKALTEDPTIFQFDEIYDKMQSEKNEASVQKKKEAKKPRYMANLMKNAERRKIEDERRNMRKIQKERETEGAEFADKESFITSSYKAKLEEFKKLEEEEERMDRLEAIGDVTKQKDLTGFYRHLYRQKVDLNSEKESANLNSNLEVKDNLESKSSLESKKKDFENLDQDDELSSEIESESESENELKSSLKRGRDVRNKRQYRKRVSESELEASAEEEEEEEDKDDDSDNENDEPEKKRNRIEEIKTNFAEIEKEKNERLRAAGENLDKIISMVMNNPEPVVVEKRSIWEKRCHGDLFEEAVRRYYERKAERLASNVVY